MGVRTDEAICVGRWDWSETSQTLALFGRECGLVRALAKGSKRDKSAFSGGVDLLTRGEIECAIKPPPAMASLRSWRLVEVFPGVRRSLRAFHAGMYFADLARHFVSEGDPHPGLYDALRAALRSLGLGADDRATVLMQWATLVQTGHRPVIDRDVRLGEPIRDASSLAFDPALGGLTRDHGPGAWRLSAGTVLVLGQLDLGAPIEAEDDAVRRTNLLLASTLRHLLGKEPPAMRALFGASLPERP